MNKESVLNNPDVRDEKLRSIFLAAPVGIGMVSNRVILEANDALCRMTGYSKAEIIGKNSSFLYPTMDEYNYVGDEKYGQIKKTGTGTVETRWKRKDGTIIDIILSSSALDRDDFSKGVTFTALDITERKKTEQALAASELKFRTFMEKSPDAIFIADSNCILQELNQRVEELTGYTTGELTGKHIKEIHLEEEVTLGLEKFHQVLNAGKATFEFRLKKKDGGSIPVLVEASLLPGNRVIGYCRDISQIKNYEEQLREYSSRIKKIADSIPELIYQYTVNDSMKGFTYMSEKAGEVFGINTDNPDFLSEYIKHIPPDYRDKFILSTEESIAKREGWFCEWPFIHNSGEIRWYRGRSNPEIRENELVFYGTIHDITKEKLAQLALESSESKYRGLVELAVDGIMLADHDGNVTDANSSAYNIIGKSRDEIIGKHISTLFTPENIKKHPLRLDILQTGKTGISERDILKADGSIASIEIHSKMMPDGSYQAIFQDITQRKKNEEALIESEGRYKELVELAVDGILTGSNEGIITGMNTQLEKMTGKTREQLLGLNISELFTDESLKNKPIQLDLLREGKTVINERVLKRDDNVTIIIESHSKMMPDGTFQSIFRDVTEKQKLAEGLQRAQKLDSLATLAGGIAHDFNNMLGGMLGYIDLARNYSKRVEDTAEYLDKAMTVFDRAKNLTGQLMTFARGGDPSLKIESIIPVLKEYASSALSGSDIKHSFSIMEDLWLTKIDHAQIGQVIYNIVTNAREFMNPDGEIKISASNITKEKSNPGQLKPGRYIKVEISDSGKGIPDEMLPHIFDPFFTTKKKGNGLGLSTSYSIILRHGGALDVESLYGKGSRFWFYLPAVIPETDGILSQETEAHQGSGIVLIMDDEYFIREIISQMLEHMGYRTFQASCGNELLDLYKTYKDNPELKCIILDLTIPGGMGGKETAAEIRKADKKIPVFASSGYSSDRIISNPGSYGFSDSIRKPFTINELSVLLNRHIK
ncbi:MAG TPA: PAS domain S-box protein [Spirochaetota bacterium]|nr:PAS domain S-box protein [Spirochaetota bacterium]